jgi:ABC-type transport system involved in cytochrome bd biosynthesis fused ATPase/permease subunit
MCINKLIKKLEKIKKKYKKIKNQNDKFTTLANILSCLNGICGIMSMYWVSKKNMKMACFFYYFQIYLIFLMVR